MATRKQYVQRDELKNRLAKIKGQVSGLQRMLDEGRTIDESLEQVGALRAALDQYAVRLFVKEFGQNNSELDPEENHNRLLRLARRLVR